jgi:hypothetical protein
MTDDAWRSTVRQKLLQVWGEQACQFPKHWPGVLTRLLKDGAASGGPGRSSLAPVVDTAVTELARLFADATPADPSHAVWCSFSKLDRPHCARLAALLIKARAVPPCC